MALEKTWQFDDNRVAGNAATAIDLTRRLLHYTKSFLMNDIALTAYDGSAIAIGAATGKWTMYYSCDGTTAGTAGDGVDRLGGATYTNTQWVRAAAGVAHSWFVLYNATLGYYMCISYEGANDYNAVVVTSTAAFTGGSTTARPTSTAEAVAPVIIFSKTASITTTNKFHGCLSTQGAFFICASEDASGGYFHLHHFGKIEDTQAGDTTDLGFGYLEEQNAGTVGAVAIVSANNWRGRSHSGGTTSAIHAVFPAYAAGSFAIEANDGTSNTYRDYPMFIKTLTPSSFRGRVVDWKWATQSLVTGDVEPIAGQPQRSVIGDTWKPARTAPSL